MISFRGSNVYPRYWRYKFLTISLLWMVVYCYSWIPPSAGSHGFVLFIPNHDSGKAVFAGVQSNRFNYVSSNRFKCPRKPSCAWMMEEQDVCCSCCSSDFEEGNDCDADSLLFDRIMNHRNHYQDDSLTRREVMTLANNSFRSAAVGMACSFLLGYTSCDYKAYGIDKSDIDTSRFDGKDSNTMIPFSSVREQKMVTLSNGLQVLLVNDKFASQSTAALVVEGAGQFTDYKELPGLAHLMEHMVLSSDCNDANGIIVSSSNNVSKDKIGDIEEWLSDNDGASNAFTAYQQVRSIL